MSYNFAAESFHTKKPMQQTFFERSILLKGKNGQFALFGPLWGLGATYAVHLMLIGKLVVDFLLVITELFSLGAFVLSQFTRVTDRRTDGFAITNTALHSLRRGKNQNKR